MAKSRLFGTKLGRVQERETGGGDIRAEDHSENPTGSPCLCLLLELQEHIPTSFVVLEKVHVVDDDNQWFSTDSCAPESDLLELVHGCVVWHEAF